MHRSILLPLVLGLVGCLPAASARPATTNSSSEASPPAATKPAKPNPKVSLADARRTALARVPGEVIEEELEQERGRWIYSFEIRPTAPNPTLKEVHVDADAGTIVAVEDEVEDDKNDSADDYD